MNNCWLCGKDLVSKAETHGKYACPTKCFEWTSNPKEGLAELKKIMEKLKEVANG